MRHHSVVNVILQYRHRRCACTSIPCEESPARLILCHIANCPTPCGCHLRVAAMPLQGS